MNSGTEGNVIYLRREIAKRHPGSSIFMANDQQRKQKAKAIQVAFNEKPRIESVKQRRLLAENLWRILDALEKEGYGKAAVVKAANLGDELSSTKPLYNYALDPQKETTTTDQKLSKRLTKTVAKYLRIIEAAAAVSKRPKDVLLQQFVSGSDYDVSIPASTRHMDHDPYESTSEFLRELGSAIARRYDLADYYQYVSEHNIIYDPVADGFMPSPRWHIMKPLAEDVISSSTWSSDLSVLRYGPFLHVYDYLIAESLAAEATQINPGDGSATSERCNGDVWIYERLFLGFLPISISGAAELCFVSEIHTELDAVHRPFPSNLESCLYGYPRRCSGVLLYPVLGSLDKALDITLVPQDDRDQFGSLSGIIHTSIHRISPASCAYFLSKNLSDHRLEYSDFMGMSLKDHCSSEARSTAPGLTDILYQTQ